MRVIPFDVVRIKYAVVPKERPAVEFRILTAADFAIIHRSAERVIGEQFDAVAHGFAQRQDHGVVPGINDAQLCLDDPCRGITGLPRRIKRHRGGLCGCGTSGAAGEDIVASGGGGGCEIGVDISRQV